MNRIMANIVVVGAGLGGVLVALETYFMHKVNRETRERETAQGITTVCIKSLVTWLSR